MLAPYAVRAGASRGREYPEASDLFRTAFQRDRDRIIHSKAFRRLKHKTQVFVIFEGDHFRTRLTHTLEVAQIARHISRMLGLSEDLVEAIALAHDLGHTPFGHAGEAQLNELLKGEGGFEHNLQSQRVVQMLENKYPSFPGLNLSAEVLEGLMKHFTPFDHPEGTEPAQIVYPSLEAQVVNLADQLAYVNHDLDDGVSAGILDPTELFKEVDLWQEAHTYNQRQYSQLTASQSRFLNVRYLINLMVLEAVSHTEKRLTELGIVSLEEVYQCKEKVVEYPAGLKKQLGQLQRYLYERFYHDYRIVRMTVKGKRFIAELFEQFKACPELLPGEEYSRIQAGEPIGRVIADYISMMTDNYVIDEHKRIFEVEKESIS